MPRSQAGIRRLLTAALTGCRITGAGIHEAGVQAANEAARERGLAERARLACADARGRLPFEDGSFDAVIYVDSTNHFYEQAAVQRDWHRLVRSGGRILITAPITATGLLRREEMLVRSDGMGEFVFNPAGLDERLIREGKTLWRTRTDRLRTSLARLATGNHTPPHEPTMPPHVLARGPRPPDRFEKGRLLRREWRYHSLRHEGTGRRSAYSGSGRTPKR